jgi:hypothetical protein
MSNPSPARYRTTNWSSYNASLRKRGSLLIWVDKDMIWRAPREGRPGRPAVFSDAAIQFCLSIKVLFKLPVRQTAGMVASLPKLAGLGRVIWCQCRRSARAVIPESELSPSRCAAQEILHPVYRFTAGPKAAHRLRIRAGDRPREIR